MITRKPKRSRTRLLALIIILGVTVGGGVTYYLNVQNSGGFSSPDFSLSVFRGVPDNPTNWAKLSSTDTLLNGTTGLNGQSQNLVVVVNASAGYNSFITFSLSGNPSGVTYSFLPLSIRPGAAGIGATGLFLTASPGATTRRDPFNFTLTATGASPRISHSLTFQLRVRSTTLFLSPRVENVAHNKTFTVGLYMQNAYDITGFQFTLRFNASLVTGLTKNVTVAPDFNNFGFVVVPPRGPVDNSTGTVTVAAVLTGRCYTAAPCINVEGGQVYNLANVTFVSNNNNINGTAPLTLTNDIVTEAIGAAVGQPPLHTIGGSVSVMLTSSSPREGSSASTPGPSSTGVAVLSLGLTSIVLALRKKYSSPRRPLPR